MLQAARRYCKASFPLIGFAALLALVIVSGSIDRPGFPHSVFWTAVWPTLVSPLFFLMPMGVGLLALAGMQRRCSIGLSTLLPCAFLVGMVLITLVLALAEKSGVLDEHLTALTIAPFILALLGWSTMRVELRSGHQKVLASVWGIIGATVLAAYCYQYLALSAYPLTDLFQEIHTMKGAVEFARFGILDPAVTDSYLPVKQALNGILVYLFSYDQLPGYWSIAIPAAMFKLSIVYGLAVEFFRRDLSRVAFTALAAASLAIFPSTNGTLAAAGCVALFSIILRLEDQLVPASGGRRIFAGVALAFAGCICVYFWWMISARLEWALGLLLVTASLLTLAARLPRALGLALLCFLMIGVLVPTHRTSLVMIPAVFGIAAVRPFCEVLRRRQSLVAAYALPVLAAGLVLVTLADHVGIIAVSAWVNREFQQFAIGLLGGAATGDDIALGIGMQEALLEWARFIGLFSLVLLGLVYLTLHTLDDHELRRVVWFWICGWIASVLILTGFPFLYRTTFLAQLLFIAAIVYAFEHVPLRSSGWRSLAVMSCAFAALAAWTYGVIVPVSWIPLLYQRLFQPVGVALLAAVVIAATMAAMSTRTARLRLAIIACVSATVLFDRLGLTLLFMKHSFGIPPASASTVSHYTLAELDLADKIAALPQRYVLMSDPYTLSVIRARTGLPSQYGYSNLDSFALDSESRVKNAIAAAIDETTPFGERRAAYCRRLGEIGKSGELKYLLKNDAHGPWGPSLLVISQRTLDWLKLPIGQRMSYFPDNTPLSQPLIDQFGAAFPIVAQSGDAIVAAAVDCTPETQ
jgi:hypothetical protein